MRHLLFHIFIAGSLLLFHQRLAAQQYPYQLNGFMGVQGGEMFTYKLELKDSVPGILSGYSYTYLNKENDVKTYLVAEVNKQNKTIYLKEKEIVYNNYFKSKAIICLVEAVLSYKANEGILSGTLNTNTAGSFNTNCSKGSVNFTKPAEVNALFNTQPVAEPEKPIAKPPVKPTRIIIDTLPQKKPVTELPTVPKNAPPLIPKPAQITEGQDKEYVWQSDQIVFEIWDGNSVDNDKVNILLNGNMYLANYTLSKDKKRITIPIGGNELNIIAIEALNEGGEPPNTAHINIWDNENKYEIIAHNKMGKKAIIRIRKKI